MRKLLITTVFALTVPVSAFALCPAPTDINYETNVLLLSPYGGQFWGSNKETSEIGIDAADYAIQQGGMYFSQRDRALKSCDRSKWLVIDAEALAGPSKDCGPKYMWSDFTNGCVRDPSAWK